LKDPHTGQPLSDTSSQAAQIWARRLLPYRDASTLRALYELAMTLSLFALFWSGAAYLFSITIWGCMLSCVPAALLLVRLFAIQHDCGHGSFFPDKRMNDLVGSCLALLTVTPYYVWKQAHKQHHATSGHLDKRGIGAIHTLTVNEYQALGKWRRLAYRLFRNPITLFIIGPAFVFLLQNRLPVEFMRGGWRYWLSAMATNLGMACLAGLLIWTIGWAAFLTVFLSTTLLAAMMGVWLFYVQHQFEETHWRRTGDWNLQEAALYGSSYYDLPDLLHWATANIGIHHVHHLNSRIPSYRLKQAVTDHPELTDINRLSLRGSLASLNLHLWDEARQRLISFAEMRRNVLLKPRQA